MRFGHFTNISLVHCSKTLTSCFTKMHLISFKLKHHVLKILVKRYISYFYFLLTYIYIFFRNLSCERHNLLYISFKLTSLFRNADQTSTPLVHFPIPCEMHLGMYANSPHLQAYDISNLLTSDLWHIQSSEISNSLASSTLWHLQSSDIRSLTYPNLRDL